MCHAGGVYVPRMKYACRTGGVCAAQEVCVPRRMSLCRAEVFVSRRSFVLIGHRMNYLATGIIVDTTYTLLIAELHTGCQIGPICSITFM